MAARGGLERLKMFEWLSVAVAEAQEGGRWEVKCCTDVATVLLVECKVKVVKVWLEYKVKV